MITSSAEKLTNKSTENVIETNISKEVKRRKLFYHDNDLLLVRIANESISALAVFIMSCFFLRKVSKFPLS